VVSCCSATWDVLGFWGFICYKISSEGVGIVVDQPKQLAERIPMHRDYVRFET
jgi:hypothetical protein